MTDPDQKRRRSDKNGWIRFWPVIIFILGMVYHAGHIQFNQSVQAEEIDKIQLEYEKTREAIAKIPVIEEKISNIDNSQKDIKTTQSEIKTEQMAMLKTLLRIEAKI